MANTSSGGWGAGAIGAFGAMIGSVVGAGLASTAFQSRQYRHVSSDHKQRAMVLATGATAVFGALVGVKLALDKGIGCPPCPTGQVRQLPAPGSPNQPTQPPSPVPTTTPATGSSSWEGGALAASGAAVGGVLAAAAAAATLDGKPFRRTSSSKRQRTLVLTSATGAVLGALFGGKMVADAGVGCGACVASVVPPGAPVTPVTPTGPTPIEPGALL